MNMRTIKHNIIWFIIAIVLYSANSYGQIYYSEIDEEQYNNWIIGNEFYPAYITLRDSSAHKGYIARINDSNNIKFKLSLDTNERTYILNEDDVITYTYNLQKWDYPTFYYKNIDNSRKHNKPTYRPLEAILLGDISVYLYKWVDIPDEFSLPFSKKKTYLVNFQFYLEKDSTLYIINNFSQDIRYLIDDNDELFKLFKKNKTYKKRDFAPYLSVIKEYNSYERKGE